MDINEFIKQDIIARHQAEKEIKEKIKGMRKSMRIISENLREFEKAVLDQKKYCSNERAYNHYLHRKRSAYVEILSNVIDMLDGLNCLKTASDSFHDPGRFCLALRSDDTGSIQIIELGKKE